MQQLLEREVGVTLKKRIDTIVMSLFRPHSLHNPFQRSRAFAYCLLNRRSLSDVPSPSRRIVRA